MRLEMMPYIRGYSAYKRNIFSSTVNFEVLEVLVTVKREIHANT
jgi:hypothetical protein